MSDPILKALQEHGSSNEGRKYLVKLIEETIDAAWKAGRDAAAEESRRWAPDEVAEHLRALKSPYEVGE